MYLLWWSDIEAHRVLAGPPVFYYFFLQIFFKNFKTEHSQTLLRKCKSKTIQNFSANNFFSDITITKHPNIVLIKKLIKSNEFGVKFLLLKDKIYTQRRNIWKPQTGGQDIWESTGGLNWEEDATTADRGEDLVTFWRIDYLCFVFKVSIHPFMFV